jgi:hypothetical protein
MKMPAISAGIPGSSLYFQCSEIDIAKRQDFERKILSSFKLKMLLRRHCNHRRQQGWRRWA